MKTIVSQVKLLTLFILVLLMTTLPQQVVFGADRTKTVHTLSYADDTPPPPQAGPDQDGDWVSDADEKRFGSDVTQVDTDGDGMSDFEEIFIWGTMPNHANLDSDHDHIFDEIEKTRFSTDPKLAEADRDGDLLFDQLELEYRTDPGKPDTDGDLLSDWLEIFLTKSNPRVFDGDENNNGYPDVIEPWLPQHLQDTLCQADVTLTINSLTIVDAEEADTFNNVVGGDEAILMYAFQVAQPSAPERPISRAHFDQKIWQGTVTEGSRITTLPRLNTMSAQCGEIMGMGLQAIEDDAPWGGVTDMGFYREDHSLYFQRLPMGWGYNQPLTYSFKGVGIDGTYQYDIHYTFEVALGSVSPAKENSEQRKNVNESVEAQPLTLAIGLLQANGEATQPLGRLETQPTAVISGTNLIDAISVTFTPDVAFIELLPGEYSIQVNAPPYDRKQTTFTLKDDYQRLLIALERPPLATDQLVLIKNAGRALVNYETGEIEATLFNGNGTIRLRDDQSNTYIEIQDGNTGIKQMVMDSNRWQGLIPPASVQGQLTSIYLAADLQKLVYANMNDLWLAEIDWSTMEIVNERQITNNGIFQYRIYYYSWSENALLANVQNRMVRIDLETGLISEAPLSSYRIEERISPDGRIALFVENGAVNVYDLMTGETSSLPGSIAVGRLHTFKWLTNRRLALQTGEGTKAQIFIFDRVDNAFSLATSIPGNYYYAGVGDTVHAPSPSGSYFFAWGDRVITENVLIHAGSGNIVTTIAQVLDGNIHWIDDTRFFYSRSERSNFGSVKIEDQGTWLYDVANNITMKISSYPYNSLVVLPEAQLAVFTANDNLWRVDVHELEPTQITSTGRYRFTEVEKVQTVTLTERSK